MTTYDSPEEYKAKTGNWPSFWDVDPETGKVDDELVDTGFEDEGNPQALLMDGRNQQAADLEDDRQEAPGGIYDAFPDLKGAAQAANMQAGIEVMDQFDGRQGFYIKSFFANTDRNGNGWKILPGSLDKCIGTGLKKKYNGRTAPFIIRQDYARPDLYGHPDPRTPDMIKDQEPARVGDFVATGVENDRGWAVIRVDDQNAINLIRTGEIKFVSPSFKVVRQDHSGNLEEWDINHLAGVSQPAYGFTAQITGSCTGTGGNCLTQLARQAGLDSGCSCRHGSCERPEGEPEAPEGDPEPAESLIDDRRYLKDDRNRQAGVVVPTDDFLEFVKKTEGPSGFEPRRLLEDDRQYLIQDVRQAADNDIFKWDGNGTPPNDKGEVWRTVMGKKVRFVVGGSVSRAYEDAGLNSDGSRPDAQGERDRPKARSYNATEIGIAKERYARNAAKLAALYKRHGELKAGGAGKEELDISLGQITWLEKTMRSDIKAFKENGITEIDGHRVAASLKEIRDSPDEFADDDLDDEPEQDEPEDLEEVMKDAEDRLKKAVEDDEDSDVRHRLYEEYKEAQENFWKGTVDSVPMPDSDPSDYEEVKAIRDIKGMIKEAEGDVDFADERLRQLHLKGEFSRNDIVDAMLELNMSVSRRNAMEGRLKELIRQNNSIPISEFEEKLRDLMNNVTVAGDEMYVYAEQVKKKGMREKFRQAVIKFHGLQEEARNYRSEFEEAHPEYFTSRSRKREYEPTSKEKKAVKASKARAENDRDMIINKQSIQAENPRHYVDADSSEIRATLARMRGILPQGTKLPSIEKQGQLESAEAFCNAMEALPQHIRMAAAVIKVEIGEKTILAGGATSNYENGNSSIEFTLSKLSDRGRTGHVVRHEFAHSVYWSRYSQEWRNEWARRIKDLPFALTPYANSYRRKKIINEGGINEISTANEAHSEYISIANRLKSEPLEDVMKDEAFSIEAFNVIDKIYRDMAGDPDWNTWKPGELIE